jgi:hypothetical protein
MDGQQPSEYVRLVVSAYVTTYAQQGRVTSLYGPQLERYTSYRGHAATEGPVKQFLFTDKGVLSISRQSVHYSHRRGLTQWHLTYVEDTRGAEGYHTTKHADLSRAGTLTLKT